MKKADLIIPFGMWMLSKGHAKNAEHFYARWGNALKRMTIPRIRQEIVSLRMELGEAKS